MATAYEVPFEPRAQTFVINLAGTPYRLTTAWNGAIPCWVLDVIDPDGTVVATGIPIVTGCNLLGQLDYLGFSGALFVQSPANPSAVPGYNDLGVSGLVFFVVP